MSKLAEFDIQSDELIIEIALAISDRPCIFAGAFSILARELAFIANTIKQRELWLLNTSLTENINPHQPEMLGFIRRLGLSVDVVICQTVKPTKNKNKQRPSEDTNYEVLGLGRAVTFSAGLVPSLHLFHRDQGVKQDNTKEW